jgi:hypothetical protein
MDAEVGKNLPANSYLAQRSLVALIISFTCPRFAMQNDSVRRD